MRMSPVENGGCPHETQGSLSAGSSHAFNLSDLVIPYSRARGPDNQAL